MATIFEDDITFTKTVTYGTTASTGLATAALSLNKTAAGTGSLNLKAAGVLRGRVQLEADEDLAIEVLDTDGTTSLGKITLAQSGVTTYTKGVTVADGTVTISETGALALLVAGLPLASTTVPLVRFGDAALVSGAAAGTFIGLNTDAATTCDLIHLQNNDTSEFRVTSAGAVTAAGLITGSAGVTVASGQALTVTGSTIVGLHEYLTLRVTNLVAADAKVYGINCPVAGTITRIASRLGGAALAAGDATITAAIGGTPVTTGAITITQSGSAQGDLDAVVPSAANTVAVGSNLTFTVGGANTDTDAFADITITVLRSA